MTAVAHYGEKTVEVREYLRCRNGKGSRSAPITVVGPNDKGATSLATGSTWRPADNGTQIRTAFSIASVLAPI